MRVVVIHPSGATETATPAGARWTLEELQALVGGYLGHRNLPDHLVALFDEDGDMRRLEINRSGSAVAGVALRGVVVIAPAAVLA
jgi:hypothetical protein